MSLKLLQQLESQSQPSTQSNGSNSSKSCLSFQLFNELFLEDTSMFLVILHLLSALFNPVGRQFKKIELKESIRYASGDPIETWLNNLLCLDLENYIPNISR